MKKFSILHWLQRHKKLNTPTEREEEIIRKGVIIERAEPGDFHAVLMDEIAVMHQQYLAQSTNSLWHAGGAFSLIDLTNRLRAVRSAKDRIINQRLTELEDSGKEQEQFNEVNEGESPHTI